MTAKACSVGAQCNMRAAGSIMWADLLTQAAVLSNQGTVQQRLLFKKRVLDLGETTPCPLCCVHMKSNILEMSLEKRLDSALDVCVPHDDPASLFAVIADIMNKVSASQKKPETPLAEMAKLYEGVLLETGTACPVDVVCGNKKELSLIKQVFKQSSIAPVVVFRQTDKPEEVCNLEKSWIFWLVLAIAIAAIIALIVVSGVLRRKMGLKLVPFTQQKAKKGRARA
jgi:heme exporter protein D